MSRLVAAIVTAALAAGALAPLSAQEWRIDVQGGRDHLQQGPVAVGASSLLLGLRVIGTERWAGIFAGVPIEEGQTPWGAAVARTRIATDTRPLRLGVDLGAQAFAQSATRAVDDGGLPGGLPGGPLDRGDAPLLAGWGATVEGLALLAARTGPFSTEIRAGAAHYHSDFDDAAFDRTLPQLQVDGTWTPDPSLLIRAEGRRYWDDDARYARVGVTGLVTEGAATLWGSAGRWVEGPTDATPWAAGVTLDLHRRAALSGSVRHEPFDPLYGAPERTTWSVGLSLRFGRPEPPAAPVPSRYENGRATIELRASDAPEGTPRIAGDFNGWSPEGMVRVGGRWTYSVALEPGVYNYAFVAPDGSWFVPESVPGRKPDGFGGWTAVLVVEER